MAQLEDGKVGDTPTRASRRSELQVFEDALRQLLGMESGKQANWQWKQDEMASWVARGWIVWIEDSAWQGSTSSWSAAATTMQDVAEQSTTISAEPTASAEPVASSAEPAASTMQDVGLMT